MRRVGGRVLIIILNNNNVSTNVRAIYNFINTRFKRSVITILIIINISTYLLVIMAQVRGEKKIKENAKECTAFCTR